MVLKKEIAISGWEALIEVVLREEDGKALGEIEAGCEQGAVEHLA